MLHVNNGGMMTKPPEHLNESPCKPIHKNFFFVLKCSKTVVGSKFSRYYYHRTDGPGKILTKPAIDYPTPPTKKKDKRLTKISSQTFSPC